MICMGRSREKLFWIDWLEKYKSLRCLWDVDSKEYTDREKRKDAYLQLVKMARQVIPTASEAFVKKRINAFRTTYRKEVKRVVEARKEGYSYEPSLYYYNQVNSILQLDNNNEEIFGDKSLEMSDTSDGEDPIATHEKTPIKSHYEESQNVEKNKANENQEESQDYEDNSYVKKTRRSKLSSLSEASRNFDCNDRNQLPVSQSKQRDGRNRHQKLKRKSRVHSPAHDDDEALAVSLYQVQQEPEDEYEIVGRRIASHLRNMKDIQRLIAEKMICDVCIQGRMDNLTWESRFSVKNASNETNQSNISFPSVRRVHRN